MIKKASALKLINPILFNSHVKKLNMRRGNTGSCIPGSCRVGFIPSSPSSGYLVPIKRLDCMRIGSVRAKKYMSSGKRTCVRYGPYVAYDETTQLTFPALAHRLHAGAR